MSEHRAEVSSGRRRFLGASVAGLIAGVGACRPAPQPDPGKDDNVAKKKFTVTTLIEGGLLRLNKSTGGVEVAYPRAEIDPQCKFPEHSMFLSRVKGDFTVTGSLPKTGPWKLSGYVVKFATGSTRKPDQSRWRKTPKMYAPESGNAEQARDPDWIPTIVGTPNEWEKNASTWLMFPTGEWAALSTKHEEVSNEYWSLKYGGTELREQYVTDQIEWEDVAETSVVLTFTRGSDEVGTITFVPEAQMTSVSLKITTPSLGDPLKKDEPVPHYCMWHTLLKDVESKFVPYRTGKKAFEIDMYLAFRDQPTPGRFCPGGKIIA